ncbi:lipoyl synthase [Glaesserella parasuis]|nr:lipoyl synthase [Glaesserella parasuis]
MGTPFKMERGVKYRDAAKTSIIPVKNIDPNQELLKKPEWMKIKLPANSAKIESIKNGMRRHGLHSVCEEASCPNLHECFNHGTATFMIMGAICTRRCPFCDVAHGKPLPLDKDEPKKLAETIQDMKLKYVVITSVDRDDLPDRGAGHFAECVKEIRALNPGIKIEILVPDFRGRIEQAIEILKENPPDVLTITLRTCHACIKKFVQVRIMNGRSNYSKNLRRFSQIFQLNQALWSV